MTTIKLYHDDISTGAAFLINLVARIPSIFTLVPDSVEAEITVDYTTSISINDDSSTSLSLHVEVLPLMSDFILSYVTIPNSENTDEGITELEPIQLSYSTIIQDGIGLMVRLGEG